MQIHIDTSEGLSDLDKKILVLLGDGATVSPAEQGAKPTPTPAKKAAAAPPKAEEPKADEPSGDKEIVLQDAVDLTTRLVSEGKAADVKAALAEAGVKRVSELKGDQIAEFVNALSA